MLPDTDHIAFTTLPDGQPYHIQQHDAFHYYAIDLDDALPPSLVQDTLGVRHIGPIGDIPNYHLFRIRRHSISSVDGDDNDVLMERVRQMRERAHSHRLLTRDAITVNGIRHIEKQVPTRGRLHRRGIIPAVDVQSALRLWDPGFARQWHLDNPEQPGNDLNVTGVWLQGITGKGVTVCIVDDGLDFDSEDLKDNFFAPGSYDFNDHVALPRPMMAEDIHGTRCAGEIAAVRNDICGVGVAYDAKVSAIRILSGDLTLADEALSLYYGSKYNQIYSCSWGPPDDGQAMDAPSDIVRKAFLRGIEKGRDGKGILYVFASGNGGRHDDNCNYDGYTNSLYTMTIGAIDRTNAHPSYSENCSALFSVAYSSGGGSYIYTTDVGVSKCAGNHGGTSAAAPLVSGIYALILQIRPDITWRDAQHILVETAQPFSLDDIGWQPVAAGRVYNHKFGFGKVDAHKMVEHAKTFVNVGPQVWVQLGPVTVNAKIPSNPYGVNSTVTVTNEHIHNAHIKRLEHITVTVNIRHQRRGDVEVHLISPKNVVSTLAPGRQYDESPDGFKNWTFLTVVHWNEAIPGPWTLNVVDRKNSRLTGSFGDWSIKLWGEAVVEAPATSPVNDHHGEKDVSITAPSKITKPRPVHLEDEPIVTEKEATTAIHGVIPLPPTKSDTEVRATTTSHELATTLSAKPLSTLNPPPAEHTTSINPSSTLASPISSTTFAISYGPFPTDLSDVVADKAAEGTLVPSTPEGTGHLAAFAALGALTVLLTFLGVFLVVRSRRRGRPGYEFHPLGDFGKDGGTARRLVSSKELLEAFGEEGASEFESDSDGGGDLLFENELLRDVEGDKGGAVGGASLARGSWEEFSSTARARDVDP